jgi:hypothetical protein
VAEAAATATAALLTADSSAEQMSRSQQLLDIKCAEMEEERQKLASSLQLAAATFTPSRQTRKVATLD